MTQDSASLKELLDTRSRSSWMTDLLDHALRYGTPPPERRVFVNRTLRLETIQHIGFDLDFTLADYEREPVERSTFDLAVERLLGEHGYPEGIRDVELRPDFPRRGLLIDRKTGIVLRMNRHRYVGQAFLGRRRLSRTEMIELFRSEPIKPADERFYHVDSLFELPEANLYAELVELSQQRPELELPDALGLFEDTRRAIDWVHASESLQAKILAEPSAYLVPDPEIALALLRLKLGKRKLILLTNSGWTYARDICAYLFDGALAGLDNWRELFDLIIVRSAKPSFFRNTRSFVKLDNEGKQIGTVETPEWGGVYRGGCLEGLMQLLDCRGDQVLYVGDHIYGDIVTTKRRSNWRTALIARELEEEFHQRAQMAHEMDELGELKSQLTTAGHQMDQLHDVLTLYGQAIEAGAGFAPDALANIEAAFAQTKDRHHRLLRKFSKLNERVSEHFNPCWGSFFKQGGSKTLFAQQMESFSCLYTSRVSNLGLYGTNHYFRVVRDPMMHEFEAS
ncbi:MAG: HAD-IG family 5'-nucleotidase [Thermoanaerobaculia bacterium]